jgi:hypothetical protein
MNGPSPLLAALLLAMSATAPVSAEQSFLIGANCYVSDLRTAAFIRVCNGAALHPPSLGPGNLTPR